MVVREPAGRVVNPAQLLRRRFGVVPGPPFRVSGHGRGLSFEDLRAVRAQRHTAFARYPFKGFNSIDAGAHGEGAPWAEDWEWPTVAARSRWDHRTVHRELCHALSVHHSGAF